MLIIFFYIYCSFIIKNMKFLYHRAKALADSDVSKAYGQAEGIKIVAKARKDEAEELS